MSTVPPIIAVSSADARGIENGATPGNPRERILQAAQQFRIERSQRLAVVVIIDGASGRIIQRVEGATWLRVARMLVADETDGSTFTAVG